MTETAETTTTVTAPKTTADVQALTGVKTTEASDSYTAYINKNLAHLEDYAPVTSEQAWVLINCYRAWQSSEERAAEKEALKAKKAEEAEAGKAAREEAKAKRLEELEAKKAEREEKAAERAKAKAEKDEARKRKAAQKAAAGEDDELDDLEEDDDEDEAPAEAPRRRRAPAKVGATSGTL